MKFFAVVALFVIGVIPVKITHVYSKQLVKTLPHHVSSIERSPAELPRGKPSIAKMPDDSREFSKQGFIRNQKTCMLIQLLPYTRWKACFARLSLDWALLCRKNKFLRTAGGRSAHI